MTTSVPLRGRDLGTAGLARSCASLNGQAKPARKPSLKVTNSLHALACWLRACSRRCRKNPRRIEAQSFSKIPP